MIELAFTLDYEIYGNGTGSLNELVYEPTKQLSSVFKEWKSTFVVFAEAAELERIEEHGTDRAIGDVRTQLRRLHDEGFEIALHLHPQWYNGRHQNGRWFLDSSEYNLCTLAAERIEEIVGRSIEYLRDVIGAPGFVPLSFRAGNWLMQPTKTLAQVLFKHGVRIDSSVFKGGRQRNHGLDYRPSLKNGYYWSFADDANRPDPSGLLLEIPIYTEMRPFWNMLSAKRFRLQKRNIATGNGGGRLNRLLDFARFSYPCKLDYCRMNYEDLRSVMDRIIREDARAPNSYKPVAAIGHSKDLVDFDTIRLFLSYLERNRIPVSNYRTVFQRLRPQHG